MIILHKLGGQSFAVNAELIKTVEASPDTVITLTTGDHFMVKETVEEILSKVVEYKKKICGRGVRS